MTYEEKTAWLNRYREAEALYHRLSYRLAEAQEAARHMTQNLCAVPGGSGDGQALARAVERDQEAEERAYAQQAVCDALYSEIENVLVQVRNNQGYVALHKYYLNCLTWEQVAEDMDVSLRWVHTLRRNAVEELEL